MWCTQSRTLLTHIHDMSCCTVHLRLRVDAHARSAANGSGYLQHMSITSSGVEQISSSSPSAEACSQCKYARGM